jgi:peptide/nickel transport system permease protein
MRYLARRIVLMVFVLWGVTFITFFLSRVVPGDPARFIAGPRANAEALANIRALYGLDRPIPDQYVTYLANLLHGDLGTSAFTHRPITSDLRDVLPPSVELVLAAMLINVLVAVPLGVLAAVHRGGLTDGASRLPVMIAPGIPVFWLGDAPAAPRREPRLVPLTGDISPTSLPAGGSPAPLSTRSSREWAAAQAPSCT